jgi:hypothetical protein
VAVLCPYLVSYLPAPARSPLSIVEPGRVFVEHHHDSRATRAYSEDQSPAGGAALTLELDFSPARIVIDFLKGIRELPDDFESNPGIRIMIRNNARHSPGLTIERYRQYLHRCFRDDCVTTTGIDLADVKERLGDLSALLSELERNRAELSHQVTRSVLNHIPEADLQCSFRAYIVVGSESQFYVAIVEGHPAIVLELRGVLKDSISESLKMFRAAADHEMWHSAFLSYVEANWRISKPLEVEDLDYRFLFTMLNEGYAHYMSILAFTGSNEAAVKMLIQKGITAAGDGFFDLFPAKISRYVAIADSKEKQGLLRESLLGNMWTKWGAMTGAMVVGILHSGLNRSEVLGLIEKEPYSIWLMYQTIAEDRHKLPPEFIGFVESLEKGESEGAFD